MSIASLLHGLLAPTCFHAPIPPASSLTTCPHVHSPFLCALFLFIVVVISCESHVAFFYRLPSHSSTGALLCKLLHYLLNATIVLSYAEHHHTLLCSQPSLALYALLYLHCSHCKLLVPLVGDHHEPSACPPCACHSLIVTAHLCATPTQYPHHMSHVAHLL